MEQEQEMRVTKRDGKLEDVSFDKILKRVKKLGAIQGATPSVVPALAVGGKDAGCIVPQVILPISLPMGVQGACPLVINYSQLVMKVIDQLYDKISTTHIDELTAEQCAALSTKHLDYAALANRIVVSNNHKNTLASFSDSMELLYNFKDVHGIHKPLIDPTLWQFINANRTTIDSMIDYSRDYLFDYFGFKTLERAYLMRVHNKVIERPQHMWMRVALGIHQTDLTSVNLLTNVNLINVKETYDLMSTKYFTHATPTLFNAGTPRPQLSSCYLISMESDSIDGIYNTLKDCAKISKWAGGIGLHIHNIRATGSHIDGTNGTSNGIVPMLRNFNATARYVDQGGGKRNGSFAVYLEPWHADVEAFLELKKNHGDEEMRARDLFYALWIPDLFMERVKADGEWALFCPHKCPGLADCFGEEFRQLYTKYVSEGKANKVIKARELWFKILDSQMETGTPYLLYKDAANRKSNQQNLGTIKSSNLCSEIIQYSDHNETAVCNLASIGLSMFVNTLDKTFDYEKLHSVTKVITRNLNKVIDINYYPTEKTRLSNLLHRPIGIGVQGLADMFALMDIPFHSEDARRVNKLVFETIYHAALECSNEIAMERQRALNNDTNTWNMGTKLFTDESNPICNTYDDKYTFILNEPARLALAKHKPILAELKNLDKAHAGAYSSFPDSPASWGELQFDMWGVDPGNGRYNWTALKESIIAHGLRNSLLVAPMPTASTSQILGNNECFEPFTSNIYSRRTNAGEFVIVNKYLMKELMDLGLWNEELKDNIIVNKGSIQHIDFIPKHIRDKYKIVWEIPMKHVIDMAADRGAYICQSQSLNLWMEDPDYKALTSMHFYAWQAGLKTGMYYLRRKAKHQAQQFTIAPTNVANGVSNANNNEKILEDEPCEMCSG